jgi:hypothetical protein
MPPRALILAHKTTGAYPRKTHSRRHVNNGYGENLVVSEIPQRDHSSI